MSGPIENLKSFGTFPRLTRKLLRLGVATRALLGHLAILSRAFASRCRGVVCKAGG
jgi:hypothetical protein